MSGRRARALRRAARAIDIWNWEFFYRDLKREYKKGLIPRG